MQCTTLFFTTRPSDHLYDWVSPGTAGVCWPGRLVGISSLEGRCLYERKSLCLITQRFFILVTFWTCSDLFNFYVITYNFCQSFWIVMKNNDIVNSRFGQRGFFSFNNRSFNNRSFNNRFFIALYCFVPFVCLFCLYLRYISSLSLTLT